MTTNVPGPVDGTAEGSEGRRARCCQLTERDRHLLGLLAISRYLTTEQLSRLFFPGRHPETARKRLVALASGKAPCLRRLQYRTFEGELVTVWALNLRGYLLAGHHLQKEIKMPRADVSADYLEHAVTMNELLVGVLVGPLECELDREKLAATGEENPTRYLNRRKECIFARTPLKGFRWHAPDSVRLPWIEYVVHTGQTRDRVIQPDAVLELPRRGARYFLEYESGAHSIQAGSDEKRGATIAKTERYDAFISGFSEDRSKAVTFYEKTFADDLAPEVLILVPSASRKQSINDALTVWHRGRGAPRLAIRALLFSEAIGHFGDLLAGLERPAQAEAPPRQVTLSATDLETIRSFYSGAVAFMKERRAEVRARLREPPPYPAATQRMFELLHRLS